VSSITQVSFWAEHPDAAVDAVAYDFFYFNGANDEFVAFTTGVGWNLFNVTLDLTPGLLLTGFSVFGNSGGRTYIDDASIQTTASVPEPGPLALAGIAVGTTLVVAEVRRRRARGGTAAAPSVWRCGRLPARPPRDGRLIRETRRSRCCVI
jgi:hypothetical protein